MMKEKRTTEKKREEEKRRGKEGETAENKKRSQVSQSGRSPQFDKIRRDRLFNTIKIYTISIYMYTYRDARERERQAGKT